MVEVFKTNVMESGRAKELIKNLIDQFPSLKINFDLDDCDKILRVEGENIQPEPVIRIVNARGYECSVLD